jgi:predicted RNA-binding Zn-ribbon protein involved in translation (DUF1610 family)
MRSVVEPSWRATTWRRPVEVKLTEWICPWCGETAVGIYDEADELAICWDCGQVFTWDEAEGND